MKLFTKQQKEKLIKNHLHHQKYLNNAYKEGYAIEHKEFKAEVKLFNPVGIGRWYLSELNPDTNVAFGLCELQEQELGYVSIDELQSIKGWGGLGIERDKFFKPTAFKDIKGVR